MNFVKQLGIAVSANVIMGVLTYIFWNKEIWGIVFLILMGIAFVSCLTILIVSLIKEYVQKEIRKTELTLTPKIWFEAEIQTLRKLRNDDIGEYRFAIQELEKSIDDRIKALEEKHNENMRNIHDSFRLVHKDFEVFDVMLKVLSAESILRDELAKMERSGKTEFNDSDFFDNITFLLSKKFNMTPEQSRIILMPFFPDKIKI